ncbi:MAG: AAA family ATPase [Candidatus Diapherotrites archaeon]
MREKKSLFKKDSGTVFMNESVLYPEYVPDALFHREKEINSLAYAFKPLMEGKKPLNVFLCGGTGIGKTASVKYVLRELEGETSRAKHLYLNCFEYSTRAGILFKLANFLGAFAPRRGMSIDELYGLILEQLKKTDFTPLIVLDEADQIINSKEESKILYDLLRVTEYQEKKIGLILISNNCELTLKLDPRTKSSLTEESIQFDKYSPMQLKDILWERAEKAFLPNSCLKEIIDVAAGHAAKLNGDARIAIESLLKAGRNADRANSPVIQLLHLKDAFIEVDSASITKSIKYLDEIEKKVLNAVASKSELSSGEAYEIYNNSEKEKLTERHLRTIISKLESKKLISAEMISMGNKGKTKKIKLNFSKELIEKIK